MSDEKSVVAQFMDNFAEYLSDFKTNVVYGDDIKFPLQVDSINIAKNNQDQKEDIGKFVSIRTCSSNAKTHLGIYLGDFPIEILHQYHIVKKELSITNHMNPAIYVPALKRIVFGCESWWGFIKTPEELKEITDQDIAVSPAITLLTAILEAEKDKE
jgi:hypothetical protein